jgi:hypothetical protein
MRWPELASYFKGSKEVATPKEIWMSEAALLNKKTFVG